MLILRVNYCDLNKPGTMWSVVPGPQLALVLVQPKRTETSHLDEV